MISICNHFIDNADEECNRFFRNNHFGSRSCDARMAMLNYVSYELLKLDLVALSKKESVS
jgi:hypothetical protein